MKRIEKERKFLLKRIPEEIEDMNGDLINEVDIEQYYTEDGTRYRQIMDRDGDFTYEKQRKKAISVGVNLEEDVEEIDDEVYEDMYENAVKHICKTRHTFEHEGRKFEVDMFDDVDFAIVEVEGVNIGEDIIFPEWLKKAIVMEVTGMPQFNNYELATEVEKVTSEDDDLPF